jgi:hypothetical protein
MSRPLSPAAVAIWEAFNDVAERVGVFDDYGNALAAAFRAAADHVSSNRAAEELNYIADQLEDR